MNVGAALSLHRKRAISIYLKHYMYLGTGTDYVYWAMYCWNSYFPPFFGENLLLIMTFYVNN